MADSDHISRPPPRGAFRTLHVDPVTWFRVHAYDKATGKYEATVFNDSGLGNARFSPLINPITKKPIPTIYASNDVRGAIAEIVLHDVPSPSIGYLHDLPRDLSGTLHLSEIELGALKLVNLTATGMKAAGLDPFELVSGEKSAYPVTRQWALWIWENLPTAQGLFWISRRDSRCKAIMLFGDRLASPDIRKVNTKPLAHYEQVIIELLDEMGAGVIPDI